MQKCRLFIMLAVLVFGGIFFLTSYGIGRCAEHIRLGFAGPLSGELSSYGISSLRGVELAIEEANNGGGIHLPTVGGVKKTMASVNNPSKSAGQTI